MSLYYILGLLGLVAIPVIILIYIIKNKYTEQTISSTYLWTLSEKFIRKRIPISRLVGILSLILQIVAVILLTLLIAHPVLILPDSASAYCFVLDASGSMNYVHEGQTRFDIGKEKIKNIISHASGGSTYTLIYAGNTTETIFQDISDKKRAIEKLDALSVTYTEPDILDALSTAQEYFDDNHAALIYFVTDTDYEETKNVNILNIAADFPVAENYALMDIDYDELGTQTVVSGKALTYVSDAQVTVEVYFGRSDTKTYEKYGEQTLDLISGQPQEFSFTCDIFNFQTFKVVIKEEDALSLDNEEVIYNSTYENIGSTLLISNQPFYVRAALTAAGNERVDVKTQEEYEAEQVTGYELYIFDSYTPQSMPRDAAVWFINPQGSVPGANFTYRNDIKYDGTPLLMKFAQPDSSTAETMSNGLFLRDYEIGHYVRCGLASAFTTVASCEGDPLIFVGSNEYGNREAVFSFSFNDSGSFTLSTDCVTLVANILSYLFPNVIEETNYVCGSKLYINVVSGCAAIRVYTPNGQEAFLDASSFISEYQLNEVGSYRIVMQMSNGNDDRIYNVFASLPENEREPFVLAREFIIEGIALDAKFDGVYDNLLILFIILAIIAVADYGVYCYEQYQLR